MSHTHRDDFEAMDHGVLDDFDAAPPALETVVTNAEAAQAATAQRALVPEAAPAQPARSFTEDVAPPPVTAREYTAGGDAEPAASAAPGGLAADDDADPTGALDSAVAVRGPPAPRTGEHGGDAAWAAPQHVEVHAFSDDPGRASEWLASNGEAGATLTQAGASWVAWLP